MVEPNSEKSEKSEKNDSKEPEMSESEVQALSEKILEMPDICEDLLELVGVRPSIAEKLIEGGYHSLELIATASPREISASTGLGEATAHKIILTARSKLNMGFITTEKLHEEQKKIFMITTGSSKLDEIIGGGIESRLITQAYGEFRTGKTQLAIELCVTALLPQELGGADGSALFIDCEGTFRTERLLQINTRFKLDEDHVLKNTFYARAYNSTHQMLIVESATSLIQEKNIKIIIVDGLMSHFRYEYVGREASYERQAQLGKFLHKLEQLAEAYNLAVFVTNQVHIDSSKFFGDPTEAVGGTVVSHCCQKILYIRKSKGNRRVARLVKCPYLPENEALFEITANGIEDP